MKPIFRFDLHRKRFRVVSNEGGTSNEGTIFQYCVDGEVFHGWYRGGPILMGQIVGTAINDHTLDLRFQCLTVTGELQSGLSRATISIADDGRLAMSFEWAWMLPGGAMSGRSAHAEV
jgi:hypothetical protein